jgi:hypothetical protein
MSESKNANLYPIIAAVCFTLYTVYSVWNSVTRAVASDYYSITWQTVTWWIIYGGLAALLFIKKKNIGFVVAAGAGVLMELFYMTQYFSIYNLWVVVVYASLLALFMVNVIPSLEKSAHVTKILGFVPFALYLAYYLFIWAKNGCFSDLAYTWKYIISSLILVAGFLFAGMWLRETIVVPVATEATNQYSTFNPAATVSQQNSSTGGADKLKMYKELLDSGAITQAEFDAKKKQILGL